MGDGSQPTTVEAAEQAPRPAPDPAPEPAPEQPPPPKAPPANPMAKVTIVVLLLAVVLFVYNLFADRMTPYTDQATVQAYVVNVAPDVGGRVKAVNVVDNQKVKAGDVLLTIDAERYQIAV